MNIQKKGCSEVFHYTDIKSFVAIVQQELIWASSFNKLNDSTEFTYAKKFINENLKNLIREQNPNDNAQEIANLFTSSLYGAMGNEIFIASFCLHEDEFTRNNGLLSMWRSYKSSEVAIVVDKSKLESINIGVRAHLDTHSVKYLKEDDSLDKVDRDHIQNLLSGIMDSSNNRQILFKSFRDLACYTKHFGFHEEKEFRLVVIRTLPNANVNDLLEVQWRNESINYVEVPFSRILVKSIICGPKTNENQREYLRSFCERHGIAVHESKIPFI